MNQMPGQTYVHIDLHIMAMSRGRYLGERAPPRPLRGGRTTRRPTNPINIDLILQSISLQSRLFSVIVTASQCKLDGGSSMVTRYAVALSLLAVAACSDSNSPNVDAQVSAQDQCDPASFNAALGNGACVRQGSVTLTAFNDELNATHQVASWQFVR